MVTAIEERFYTVMQVADLIGRCPATVRRMIRRGELGSHQQGRWLRVAESDLNAYLDGARGPRADSVAPRSRRRTR